MGRVKKLLKNKCVLYVLLAMFCLLLACLTKEYDYDLYARLIVGEVFVEKGQILYQDFLSYTPTHLWYDHEWGASVIFYWFFKYLGPFGLVLIQALTMFVTIFFIIKTQSLQKHAYPPSLAFSACFLMLFAHQNPSIVRCHMFSFMFFAMFIYILEKTRLYNSNLIWAIPPIVIIWNNLHGGVVSGLGMIAIYMAGAVLSRKPWVKYFGVLIVSVPLLAINPYGADYLNFLISANMKTRTYITEWWSVFVQRHVLYYYPIFCVAVFIILLTITGLFCKNKINITKIIALVTTAALGILHVKLLSLVLIVIASLYYKDIIRLFEKSMCKLIEKTAYILIFLSLFCIPFTNACTPKLNEYKFPILESEFLLINEIKGNIVTAFGLGSYVSYKLYPQNLIYMDGRYEEVYYDREFDNLMKYDKAEAGWDDIINLYPSEILMPDKTAPIYKLLQKNPEWKEIFTGPVCGIFIRKSDAKESYLKPESDLKYYQQTAFKNLGKFCE